MIRPGYLRVGLAASVLLCAVVLLSGCGSGSPSAEGTVTLDLQPVDGGTIAFIPMGDAEGEGKRPAAGGEIKEGKYNVDAAHKLKPGKYKVEIRWPKKTTAKKGADPDVTSGADAKEAIPKKYNAESKETVEVKSGSNKFDYTLTSR
jgi:hypothetical protein